MTAGNPEEPRAARLWRLAALTGVLLGLALRVWQYADASSIWVDEAALARNVLDRSASELLQPLDYGQVAPPGFLLAAKLSSRMLGWSEYALRAFPMIAGITSVVLFFLVARTILRPVAASVAIVMFSVAPPLIYFSSNVKQYSSDVAAALLMTAVVLRIRSAALTPRTTSLCVMAGVLALFFSEAAVIPVTAAGAVVLADAVALHRPDRRYRVAMVVLWALAVSAAMFHGLSSVTPANSAYLQRYWQQGFVPGHEPLRWLWTASGNIFGSLGQVGHDGTLHYPWPAMFVVLTAIGAVAMVVESPVDGTLVAGPVALTIAASAAHAFPFGTRVDLFLLPLLLLLAVAGTDWIGRMLVRSRPGEYAALLLLPFVLGGFLHQPPPYRMEHLRPVMQYVSDHWRPGDLLWVYYGAGQAFEYYRKLIPIGGHFRVGRCNREDLRDYLRQVDVERGHARVWILMSHDYGGAKGSERRLIGNYLDAIGTRLDQFHAPEDDFASSRAEVLLYDLSDENKLAAASAETFAIPRDYPAQPWTCYGTMSPSRPSRRVPLRR